MADEKEDLSGLSSNRGECPEVAIIILNWNNYEDTAECLESVREIDYPNYETIVVDNGSIDGSGQRLKEEFEWCKFIFNEENLGFAGGVNSALDSLCDEYDYFLLLNNDVVIEPDTLRLLLQAADSGPDVGIVGPKILYHDSDLIQSAGREYKSFVNIHEGKHESEINGITEVGGIIGACMLINAKMMNQIGTLDEDFFFQGEDREYCLRATAKGWKIVLQADSIVSHKHHSSSSIGFRRYHRTKGHILVKNKAVQYSFLSILLEFFYNTIRAMGHTILGNPTESKAILLAYYDLTLGDRQNPRLELLS